MLRAIRTDDDLQKHVSATYYTLRWGVAIIAAAFPFVLWIGGQVLYRLPLQDSMSAYYHAPLGASSGEMRNVFVGVLFTLAGLMYVYKGLTQTENILLNVASVLAAGVAVFPMAWPPDSGGGLFSLHGICAVGAFVCLALVALISPWLRGMSKEMMMDARQRFKYAAAYRVVGVFMVVFPVLAWVLTTMANNSGRFVFVAETFGLLGFTGYWVTKSLEIRATHSEMKALLRSGAGDSSGMRLESV